MTQLVYFRIVQSEPFGLSDCVNILSQQLMFIHQQQQAYMEDNQLIKEDNHPYSQHIIYPNPLQNEGSLHNSEHLQDYLDFVGISRDDLKKKKQECYEIIKKRATNQYKVKIVEQFRQFNAEILEESRMKDVLEVFVAYGYFQMVLTILISDQKSPTQRLSTKLQGKFGSVYQITLFGEQIAIKSFSFSEQSQCFHQIFCMALKEYFILVIASFIEAGPYLSINKDFNLIIYRNCIEFSMELCKQDFNHREMREEDLKKAILELHSIGIVHYDIKPENICYSSINQKCVFIDFGISEITHQPIGFKRLVKGLRGTLNYCLDEMKKCVYLHEGWVDCYYNDVHCLKNVMRVIAEKKFTFLLDETERFEDLSSAYIEKKILFNLLLYDDDEDSQLVRLFIRFQQQWGLKQQEIFIKHIAFEYGKNFTTFIIQKFMTKPQIKEINFLGEDEKVTFYEQKSKQIKNIIRQSSYDDSADESKRYLLNIQQIENLDKDIYCIVLATYLKIEDTLCSYEEKMKMADIYLAIARRQIMKNELKYEVVVESLFDFSMSQPLTEIKQLIMDEIIVSVIVLEVKTQEQIIKAFKKMVNDLRMETQSKARIIFKYLSALVWLQYKFITSYKTNRLSYILWQQTKNYVVNQYQKDAESTHFLYVFVIIKFYHTFIKNKNRYGLPQLEGQLEYTYRQNVKLLSPPKLQIDNFIRYLLYTEIDQSNQSKKSEYFVELMSCINSNQQNYPNQFTYQSMFLLKYYMHHQQQSKIDNLFFEYEKAFKEYKFYKHFEQYLYYNFLQISKKLPHKEQLINQSCSLLVQSQVIERKWVFIQVMKDNVDDLRIIYQKINMNTQFWQEFNSQIEQSHSIDPSNHNLFLNLRIYSSFLMEILKNQKYFLSSKQFENLIFSSMRTYLIQMSSKVKTVKCFECKVFCFFELIEKQIGFYRFSDQNECAINVIMQFMTFCLKERSLLINMQYFCKAIITFRQFICEISLLCFEFVTLSRNYNLFFNNIGELIHQIYYLLFRRMQYPAISHFITKVTEVLLHQKDQKHIYIFCREMDLLYVRVIANQQIEYFFDQHQTFVPSLQNTNPYLAIYLLTILRTKTKIIKNMYLFYSIAISLNSLDSTSRQFILSHYYRLFLQNYDRINHRHKRYLKHQNLKHAQNLVHNIKRNPSTNRINKPFSKKTATIDFYQQKYLTKTIEI